ncbi:PD-(D/E)XK nuclease family protein [Salinirubellus salinus]|uniref:PD-(D/E)XK nuclease family protein n=1 Tax=Salinirubellus salinus TaxID=1364945 RepID=A0A9E7R216_9EURY|nr:PD-(D/E)XK nuclease family protein [Salinirubellus salinus]UWM53408.1 PD-(D/E)XK nuclease family protein [Salinirubellus salinus]
MTRRTLAGPSHALLERAAFDTLSSTVGDTPSSLLYLARSAHAERRTRDRWRAYGPSAALSVESFDSVVGDCHERERYVGRATHVDQPLRDRLVELAVEELDDPSNPLHSADLAASGLCAQVEDLLSLFEFADLLSPEAVRARLEAEGLDLQAETATAVAETFADARETVLADHAAETFRAERYHRVVETDTPLDSLLPSVDAVVLGGFSLFSPLEKRLVERLADTWPTVALVPQMTPDEDAVGIDRGAERALSAYREMGFEYESVDTEPSGRLAAARSLYRPTGVAETDGPVDGIDLVRPETVPGELRHVARDLRERIADGTPPERLGVVLTAPGAYRERLVETLEQYDVPATLAVERSFGETALGEVLASLSSLSREDPTLETVTALYSNPLVDPDLPEGAVAELGRVGARLRSPRLTTAHHHLDGPLAAAVRSFVTDAQRLRETSLADLSERIDALLERLGVPDRIDDLPRTPRAKTERDARKRLDRTLETLAATDGHADLDRGDAVDRLDRALAGLTLEADDTREDHVVVCGLDEAAAHEFDHTYLLGLTAGHFPKNAERLAFTRPINEAHPDFEQADTQQRARYHVGLLLASDASLTLSVPERDLSGDPYVEADVVTELRRVTDLAFEPVDHTDTRPGSREDVQRSLARRFAHETVEEYTPDVDRAAEMGAFDELRRRRTQQGVACAAARASPALTAYDGQLSAETVAALHGTDEREPYSASRLETYATCGFEYYVRRVLGIEDPDEVGLEPDARARGGFVHDVLERYYVGLQGVPGDPVALVGDRAREGHLLDVALETLDERFDADPTAFQREWLVGVFAGLDDPAENPYHGEDGFGSPERGLLVRFLDHEFDEVSKATPRPAWFEARVGDSPYDDREPLQRDPVRIQTAVGEVPIHGMVDRIDAVPGTQPTELVVRDYKTGGTPSETDTLGGTAFQLPLYALLAEGVLDDVETVGGAYYQVKPPTGVNHRKGLVGSDELTDYARTSDSEKPQTTWRYPLFQTHEAFRRFVEEETPRRLGRLADGITEGRFQPTLVDSGTAGCRYCGYADVCDVRHHRRRDVVDWIDDAGHGAYVPLATRDGDLAETLEVE